MIARGLLDAHSVQEILAEIAAATIHRNDCKVLIDLIDTDPDVDLAILGGLLHEGGVGLRSPECKMALVSSLKDEPYKRISAISTFLAERDFRIALFSDANNAIDWLFFSR
jgi:hypothetical protein